MKRPSKAEMEAFREARRGHRRGGKYTRMTAAGVLIEITNTVHGCLEQGGISGRLELWTWSALHDLNITRETDLNAVINEHGTTEEERLLHIRAGMMQESDELPEDVIILDAGEEIR